MCYIHMSWRESWLDAEEECVVSRQVSVVTNAKIQLNGNQEQSTQPLDNKLKKQMQYQKCICNENVGIWKK